MKDPRNMKPAELRLAAIATDSTARGLWLHQAEIYRRIHDETLFTKWGFETWTAYLESELPHVEPRTAKRLVQVLRYVEEREHDLLEHALAGGSGTMGDLPDYNAVARLAALAHKVEKHEVRAEDHETLHRQAFDGVLTGKRVRERVAELVGKRPRRERGVVEAIAAAINAMRGAPDDRSTPEALAELLRVFREKHGEIEMRGVLDRAGVASAVPAEARVEVVEEEPEPTRRRHSNPVEATAAVEETAPTVEPAADPVAARDEESPKLKRTRRGAPPMEPEPALAAEASLPAATPELDFATPASVATS